MMPMAAMCISSNMFRLLLLAAPSVPRATFSPRSSISGTGAKPLPSFRLLVGLWMGLTPWVLRMSRSPWVHHTQ